jgi:hypothetical protein
VMEVFTDEDRGWIRDQVARHIGNMGGGDWETPIGRNIIHLVARLFAERHDEVALAVLNVFSLAGQGRGDEALAVLLNLQTEPSERLGYDFSEN